MVSQVLIVSLISMARAQFHYDPTVFDLHVLLGWYGLGYCRNDMDAEGDA